jgi:hypothetical protein
MNHFKNHRCALCGEERSPNQARFLLAENTWEDKLTILQWDAEIASRAGIQVACSIDHVEELVIHWMITGRLDYPFARITLGTTTRRNITTRGAPVDISGGRQVGELAVHRESIERILAENPKSLKMVLEALIDALRQETLDTEPVSLHPAERKKDEKEFCEISSKAER